MTDTRKELEAEIAEIEKLKAAKERKLKALDNAQTHKRLSPEDKDRLLKIASESLDKYGELVPPREIRLLLESRTCSHCGEEKPIPTGFGFTKDRKGRLASYSWCKACRSSPDSHPTRTRFGRKKY